MGRNMLKWPGRRRYRLRDTPYAPLLESPDKSSAGIMTRSKTTALRSTTRLSDISKASLARLAVMKSAGSTKSDVDPKNETYESEQSSFVTISSEELNLEGSDAESERSQHVKGNAFRRFSESSISSVAKMSSKWSKVRDSLIKARLSSSTLPEVTDNTHRKPGSSFGKPDAAMLSGKNPRERIKRASSLLSRKKRWSLFSTNYVKLSNSDSSPNTTCFEDAAHSTLIQESKHKQGGKHNHGTELEGPATVHQAPVREKFITDTSLGCIPKHQRSNTNEVDNKLSLHKAKGTVGNVKKMSVQKSSGINITSERNIKRVKRMKTKRYKSSGRARLPKTRRDSYSLQTLSVKSSEGKVEVKISLQLSDGRKGNRNSSSSDSSAVGVTNTYYLKSQRKKIDVTPVLPRRPLSRRSLFSDTASPRDTIGLTDRESEMSLSKIWIDKSEASELNTEHSAQEKIVHLSPHIGETDHIITPPNKKEVQLSIEQSAKARPSRVRKPRGMTLRARNV